MRANRPLGGYLLIALVFAAALPSLPARAVVNAGGNANDSGMLPTDNPGFFNVGSTGGASIIYLNNRWAITASHVTITAGYPQFWTSPSVAASYQIANAVGGIYAGIPEFGTADLKLVNLTTDPALPALSIDSRVPHITDPVTMIGNGRPQFSGLVQEYWNVTTPSSGTLWTWNGTGAPPSVNPIPANFFTNYYGGVNPPIPASTYQASAASYGSGQEIRWGLNQIAGTTTLSGSGYSTSSFYTVFNDPRFAPGGTTATGGNEAQASLGDSGGAVFYKGTSGWKLDGLMIGIDLYPNKPDQYSAAFGEPTYIADLTAYRTTIMRIISPLTWTGATNSTWDTTSHNWLGSFDGSLVYYDVSSPTFSDLGVANSNITIQAAGVQPAAVSFNNSTATIYTLGNAGSSAIGITGTTGITKTGTGAVALAGANSFTGPVQISAGRIILQNSNALGGSSGVVVSSGAALELQNGVIAGTSATSPTTTIPLTIYGTGLASNPAGALNSANGSSEYKGTITIGAGGATINCAATGSLLTLSGGIATGVNPLTLSGPGNITINSNIWGSGSLIKTGAGYLSLTGSNSYTGGTSINNGVVLTSTLGSPSNPVVVSAANGVTTALVLSSNFNQSVGSLAGTVGSGSSAVVSIGALSTLTVNQATNTNFGGTLQNSGTFVKSGTGTLEIDGAPQLISNAAVQVNGGTLKFNVAAPATASVGSGVTVSVASGATLQLAGNSPALSGAGNYADIANSSQAAGGGLAITGAGQQVGAITGTGSTVVSGGSDVTASSIIQGALIIAGSSGDFGSVTIRDSSATGGKLAGSAGPDTSTAAASTQWLADALASMPADMAMPSSASSFSKPPQDFGSVSSGAQPLGSNGVPEPSTIGLVLIAAMSWAALRLRRWRS